MTRIQDDLFEAVNADWLAATEIPADRPRIAAFDELVIENEAKLAADMAEFVKLEPSDTLLKQAVRFYKKAGDWTSRNADDFSALKVELRKVSSLSNLADLNKQASNLIFHSQAAMPWGLSVGVDMKDALHHALEFTGPGLILPDTSYYAEDHPRKSELLEFWKRNSAEILAKFDVADAEKIAEDAVKFDALLVPVSNTSEEWAKYAELYHPVEFSEFTGHLKNIDFAGLIERLIGHKIDKILVFEERFYDQFDKIVNEENWPLLKSWMLVKTARKATNYLSEELRVLGTAYGRFLQNTAEPRSQVKHQLDITENYFDQVIGLYYGRKYFGESAKADVKRMVAAMISVYQDRLDKNTWLSRETIDLAIDKLNGLTVFVGYPDKLPEVYDKLIVGEGSLYEDAITFDEILTKRHFEKFPELVDKTEWHMPAHMVNAYYSPDANTIVFPAAILQAPFYSLEKQSATENFGGIGAVIAHEISHAFDNNGAQFDKFGNLHKWWTDKDYAAFETKQAEMIEEFDGLETEAGKANGKLIVSENIADNGGIACALSAAQKEADYNAQEFFEQWGKIWRMKASIEYQQMLLSMDVHAPGKLRANVPPTNLEEFYKAFNVKEGDKMFRPEEKRVNIW
ncbi:MAG: peptidase M13 [Streptococcaceae bacterium]|jgi:putative endopeptidase|nr:peptidase M13 [Streptococcaceae bacterium]